MIVANTDRRDILRCNTYLYKKVLGSLGSVANVLTDPRTGTVVPVQNVVVEPLLRLLHDRADLVKRIDVFFGDRVALLAPAGRTLRAADEIPAYLFDTQSRGQDAATNSLSTSSGAVPARDFRSRLPWGISAWLCLNSSWLST